MRFSLFHPAAAAVLALLFPVTASAQSETYAFGGEANRDPDKFHVSLGGYLQPQFRIRQNDRTPFDEDGFRLRRARLFVTAEQPTELVDFALVLEGELTPDFSLFDAYVSASGELPSRGRWELDLGQVRAPISRQTLVSESELQFPERAELTTLAPDRQIGLRAIVLVPYIPWVEISGGIFNGEGRNQVQNADENFLYVGRVAFRPIGPRAHLEESALALDQVSIAGSIGYQRTPTSDSNENLLYLSADAFASYAGVSVAAEYLRVKHDPRGPELEFDSQAFFAQLGYLMPLPGIMYRRLEVAGRLQQIDRNDTIPIEMAGSETQSQRVFEVALSYYHRAHDLKLQVSYQHIQELEDTDAGGNDAKLDNDTALFQVTYRVR